MQADYLPAELLQKQKKKRQTNKKLCLKKKCSLPLTDELLSQLTDTGVLIRREIHTGKRKPHGDTDTQREDGHAHRGRETGRVPQKGPTRLESNRKPEEAGEDSPLQVPKRYHSHWTPRFQTSDLRTVGQYSSDVVSHPNRSTLLQ